MCFDAAPARFTVADRREGRVLIVLFVFVLAFVFVLVLVLVLMLVLVLVSVSLGFVHALDVSIICLLKLRKRCGATAGSRRLAVRPTDIPKWSMSRQDGAAGGDARACPTLHPSLLLGRGQRGATGISLR